MAEIPSSPSTQDQTDTQPKTESEPPALQSNQTDSFSSTIATPSTLVVPINPNQTSNLVSPPTIIPSFTPAAVVPPPSTVSFRPPVVPPQPQFSPLPNPTLPNFVNLSVQNPNPSLQVQPPGVLATPLPGMIPGSIAGPVSASGVYQSQVPPTVRPPYAPMPNGFTPAPIAAPQGAMPPPGILRYPPPYVTMVRPAFPPRPPGVVGVPLLTRPPIPGIRPIVPLVRPAVVPPVTPAEKPHTTVYVGKIAVTVENDFMLSVLKLCGPVKSWKQAQNPSNGTSKGFGFCEFESAEGVLRALRLLAKVSIDGQQLMLNVDQATKKYLERYVEKKTKEKNDRETETEKKEKEDSAPGVEKNEPLKPQAEDSEKDGNELGNKVDNDTANFGIVTDEDRDADHEALEKLTNMIEERLKTKPLPPPPPPPQSAADGSGNAKSEVPAKLRDGDSDVDITRNDGVDGKNDDETTSENKTSNEHDKPDTSSPDRSKRYDRRSKERDRERDLKREKERELERYERERERERVRKEKERELKLREADRLYKERVKEWEARERDKEYQREHEKKREKERERERKRDIMDQEDESDDDDIRRRRRRSSALEEKRKKRLREKEDDLIDRLKEEEEITEAKRRAIEKQQEQQQKDALRLLSGNISNGAERNESLEEKDLETKSKVADQISEAESGQKNHIGDGMQNGNGDESTMASVAVSDAHQGNSIPGKKLGFGLVGSGKRAAVHSVFNDDEDEDAQKDKKMRPLVPIDYSTEELQAVQATNSGTTPPNFAAAVEYAKRISNTNIKEDNKPDPEKERTRRPHERSIHHERSTHRDRNTEDANRARDDKKEKNLDGDRDREHRQDKLKTTDNKKLLDAKQLIDMIPKTKDELFSYEINWAVYDKIDLKFPITAQHELHERMRPWISKKITEFLGEEEKSLVDYIVSSTQEHVKASQMLELLQSILDEEAEMFVLKMWRMLIFEIKKVETGLSLRSKK
ncbi:RNA recognition motif domain [Dillenia turbinata]|uniref:RNA recognition motif domain n=1 Tax=Dillenia turbinata TaxID=194707 RepID=A0AAN8Z4A1_9MAGN